jgi:membrane associated rhomboid family serine protease
MKIKFNSPVVLIFTIASFIEVIFLRNTQLHYLFILPGNIQLTNPLFFLKLFLWPIGHANFKHFANNFTFILLIGPILEEKIGSKKLLFFMIITILVTDIIHIFFFSSGLLGASGIVFLFIILASITNTSKNEIPLTFILIAFIFLGKEFSQLGSKNHIAHYAHLIGGAIGGFVGLKKR